MSKTACKDCGWSKAAHSRRNKSYRPEACPAFRGEWGARLTFPPFVEGKSRWDPRDPKRDSIWLELEDELPGEQWKTAYRMMLKDGELVVAEVRVYPRDAPGAYVQTGAGEWSGDVSSLPKGGLPQVRLRQVRIGEARKRIAREIDSWRREAGSELDQQLTARGIPVEAFVPRRTRERQRYLAEVARSYVMFVESGSRSPVVQLANELGVTRDRARDVLHDIRRAKLLTSPRKGVAGGQLTEKARQILAEEEREKQ